MKMTSLNIYSLYLFFLCLVMSACKKEVSPVTREADARINFYNASEYEIRKGFPQHAPPYLFIDRYDTSSLALPAAIRLNGPDYPDSRPGGYRLGKGEVFFKAMPAGEHHFMFADTDKQVQADTLLNMPSGSYTTLYLADSLLHYTVLGIQEDPMEQDTAVRVRFINLSPDTELGLRMITEDGSSTAANLPQQLAYRSISPYITLDREGALNGSFFLRIYHQDTEEGNVTLRAEPGRAYVVVVQGYRAAVSMNNPDPVNGPEIIRFERSLRATVRTIH